MAKGFVILCVEGFFFCFFIHSVVTFAVLLLCLIHFSLVHEPPTNCVLYLSVSLCVWCVIQFFFCFLSLLFFFPASHFLERLLNIFLPNSGSNFIQSRAIFYPCMLLSFTRRCRNRRKKESTQTPRHTYLYSFEFNINDTLLCAHSFVRFTVFSVMLCADVTKSPLVMLFFLLEWWQCEGYGF